MGQQIHKKMTLILIVTIYLSLFQPSNQNILARTDSNGSNIIAPNSNIENDRVTELDNFPQIGNDNLIKNSLDYTPILNINQTSDDFNGEETLQVNHNFDLNFTHENIRTNSFTISEITGFNDISLEYNITSINAIEDYYPVEDKVSGYYRLSSTNYICLVQGFVITWDYAKFTGVNLSMDIGGTGTLGDYSLDILLANDTGAYPDFTNIISSDLNGPYNESNPVTTGFDFYDFPDVILEKGKYLIIANLTQYSSPDGEYFEWDSKNGAPIDGITYRRDNTGTWANITNSFDLLLVPKLLPLDADKNTLTFSNPVDIGLLDNTFAITSSTDTISTTGLHTLTYSSGISVSISFNNSYIFSRDFLCSSSFQAYNSTYGDYSNVWELNWTNSGFDYSPYSNLYRTLLMLTPTDWSNSPLLSDNMSTEISISKVSSGYEIYLSNDNNAGEFIITTTSPNYIADVTLSNGFVETNEFRLGYWTTDETNAIGHNGSTAYLEANIFDNLISGELNYSLYNGDGLILPKKTSLPANLDYTDVTNYTYVGHVDGIFFKSNITIDPSIYGSDVEGYWTISIFWKNGTEVGLFNKRISIVKPTLVEFEWEVSPNSDTWTSSTATPITRINGDSINVRVRYYNISDPFFSGIGNAITAATVSYETSWDFSALISYSSSQYNATISTNLVTGIYDISLQTTGDFLESYSVQFYVKIIHQQLDINPIQTSYYTYFSNEVIRFRLEDISNNSVAVFPDVIDLELDGTPLQITDYTNRTLNELIEVTIDTSYLGLAVGSYELNMSLSKRDFVAYYSEENATISFDLYIENIVTEIEPVSLSTHIHHNNQTTLSFMYIDTNHSTYITSAEFNVTSDIEEIEIITLHEEDGGLYTVVLRIFEPTVSSMNLFINIDKPGYESQINFHLTSLNIVAPDPGNGGNFPVYLIVIIAAGSFGIVVVVSFLIFYFFVRKTPFEKLSNIEIYDTVQQIRKILFVHKETTLAVFEIDFGSMITHDSSLITGFLQAISSLGDEITGTDAGGIRKLQYLNLVVTSAPSEGFITYLFSESDLLPEFEDNLNALSVWFTNIFQDEIDRWNGDPQVFQEKAEEIYDAIDHIFKLWLTKRLRLITEIDVNLKKFGDFGKQVYEIASHMQSFSIQDLIDSVHEVEERENLLETIFDFYDAQIIQRDADFLRAPSFQSVGAIQMTLTPSESENDERAEDKTENGEGNIEVEFQPIPIPKPEAKPEVELEKHSAEILPITEEIKPIATEKERISKPESIDSEMKLETISSDEDSMDEELKIDEEIPADEDSMDEELKIDEEIPVDEDSVTKKIEQTVAEKEDEIKTEQDIPSETEDEHKTVKQIEETSEPIETEKVAEKESISKTDDFSPSESVDEVRSRFKRQPFLGETAAEVRAKLKSPDGPIREAKVRKYKDESDANEEETESTDTDVS